MAIASPNPLLEAAVESIEVEAFAEKIPDLVYHGTTTYSLFKQKAHTQKVSNETSAGGTARPSFRIPFRVQAGAAIAQGTGNGDSLYRGSGSQWAAFAVSPVFVYNVCEITWLAQQSTDGKEKGLFEVKAQEMKNSLDTAMQGLEALCNADGSGMLDQIPTTATVNNNTGTGQSTSSIVGMNIAAAFVDQQNVTVYPTETSASPRGSFTISYVDPVSQTIYSAGALPAGTTTGDIIVVLGATGAAGSSVYGKDYWINNGNVGTIAGINKALFPGRFSTPTINFAGAGSIVNSTAQRIESIRLRALGDEYDENKDGFWYTNPMQGVALSMNYYNPGYTRLDEGGDREVPDTAKMHMQKTWGGREVVYSSTAEPSRMDLIVPSTWYFGELFPTRLHEWTPGNPIAAVPTNDGTGATTYFDSQMFGYERGFNLICQNPKEQFYLQGLPIPQDA